jgi:3-hydroxyacyl-CoA dehydrogenase
MSYPAPPHPQPQTERIALLGLGSIGLSFLSLHLTHTTYPIRIHDPRPDLLSHLRSILPGYLSSSPALNTDTLLQSGRLKICDSVEEACEGATIVQEQGPERVEFKRDIWRRVGVVVGEGTRLWSSTSGIGASLQSEGLEGGIGGRLVVVHPFNPPHILPLLEIVPGKDTKAEEVEFARTYFQRLGSGHRPVIVRKEIPGFVGNRLAFVLFREACWLVEQGVIDVKDLDTIVMASLGPRWAVQGVFESYNMGGGAGGLGAFLENLKVTMGGIWEGAGKLDVEEEGWKETVTRQTREVYGTPGAEGYEGRDGALREVLKAQGGIGKVAKGDRV